MFSRQSKRKNELGKIASRIRLLSFGGRCKKKARHRKFHIRLVFLAQIFKHIKNASRVLKRQVENIYTGKKKASWNNMLNFTTVECYICCRHILETCLRLQDAKLALKLLEPLLYDG